MFNISMQANFGKILDLFTEDTLFDISEAVFSVPMDYLAFTMRNKVKTIKRKRVKVKTRAWRKWAARKGLQVEHLHGQFAGVIPKSNVGMRTGTLLSQLENFSAPTVDKQVSKDKTGGVLYFSINSDVYVNNYPEIFSAYLESKKGIEGGIGFTLDEKNHALDLLEYEVVSLIQNRW